MKRRAYIIGTVALGLIAAAVEGGPGWRKVVSSAERFRSNFEELRTSGSFNPVERVVFSIVLANAKTAPAPLDHSRT